jgi:predicted O-methyltransferase YrrM
MWMARAIPSDGRFVGLESDEKAAEICRTNLARGGFKAPQFEILGGPRLDALKALSETFDFAFVRAETTGNVQLLVEVKKLVRKGGIIVSLG